MGTTVKSACTCRQSGEQTSSQPQKHVLYERQKNSNKQNQQTPSNETTKRDSNRSKKIFQLDFQIDGILGKGGFGIVYLGQLKSNIAKGKIQKYAIKKVLKQLLLRKKVLDNAIVDKTILSTHNCNFIAILIMAFQDPWYIYFVMEYASGGDTYSLIQFNSPRLNDFKNLGQTAIRFIAACVILGLQYLHQNNYMYRDLKPQNVLIFQNGYVKLTDFGLAMKSQQGSLSKLVSGTQLYYAPQMVLGNGYNKKIDLWALGIYLYQLSNYQPPFTLYQITKTSFQAAIRQSQVNRIWKNNTLSLQLKSLINNLLKFDQKQRIGYNNWQQIKQHPFFYQFNWKQLELLKMTSPLLSIVKKYQISPNQYRPQPPLTNSKISLQKLPQWSWSFAHSKNAKQNHA